MKKSIKPVKKTVVNFRPMILSRHPSHNVLRKGLPLMKGIRSVVRFGSPTELNDTVAKGGIRIEINTTKAIANSANKLLMKKCFDKLNVKTATWFVTKDGVSFVEQGGSQKTININELPYPIVSKKLFGSRGKGNSLLKSAEELKNLLRGKDLSDFIFEQYLNYNREYRLHVNSDGCFYTCRKMIKENTPEDKRWFKNDSNSVWIMETNPSFDKPSNWDAIVKECVKALNAVGLDFGACDLRVQSSKDKKEKIRQNPDFFIVEINSAPSFGEVTAKKYAEVLPKMILKKATS